MPSRDRISSYGAWLVVSFLFTQFVSQHAQTIDDDANALLEFQSLVPGLQSVLQWSESRKATICVDGLESAVATTASRIFTCSIFSLFPEFDFPDSYVNATATSTLVRLTELKVLGLDNIRFIGECDPKLLELPHFEALLLYGAHCNLALPERISPTFKKLILHSINVTNLPSAFPWSQLETIEILKGQLQCPLPETLVARMREEFACILKSNGLFIDDEIELTATKCEVVPQLELSTRRRNNTVVKQTSRWHLEIEESVVYFYTRDRSGAVMRSDYIALLVQPSVEEADTNLALSNMSSDVYWSSETVLVIPFTVQNRTGAAFNCSITLELGNDRGNLRLRAEVLRYNFDVSAIPAFRNTSTSIFLHFIFHAQHSAPGDEPMECPDPRVLVSGFPCKSAVAEMRLGFPEESNSSSGSLTEVAFIVTFENAATSMQLVGVLPNLLAIQNGDIFLSQFETYQKIAEYVRIGRLDAIAPVAAAADQELRLLLPKSFGFNASVSTVSYNPPSVLLRKFPEQAPSIAAITEIQDSKTAAIVGGLIGSVVATTIIVAVAVLFKRRKSGNRTRGKPLDDLSMDSIRLQKPLGQLAYMQELGKGSSGSVMLATYNGEFVAVKRIADHHYHDPDKASDRGDNALLSEAQLMASLKTHPNVVKFVDLVQEPTGPAIIMEFCPRGSIANRIKKQPMSEYELFKFAYGISSGMASLALAGIVHRDLACRNVLLSEHLQPKVSDFGIAAAVSRRADALATSDAVDSQQLGPIKWQAPEVLRDGIYSEQSDVWAYGCCLIEMLTRREPYHGFKGTIIELIAKIRDEAYSPLAHLQGSGGGIELPDWVVSILRSCFHQSPTQRPQFREIRYNLGKLQRAWKNAVEDEMDELESILSVPGAYNSVAPSAAHTQADEPTRGTALSSTSNTCQVVFASPVLPVNAAALDLVNIERLSKLGSGSFGSVYLGQSQGIYVALKVLDAAGHEDEVKREAHVMMSIQAHRNIVQIYGLVSQQDQLSIVMEFAPRGSLESYVMAQYAAGASSSTITEGQLFRWAVGIARGMASLSSSNVVHRDLALRNILLDSALEPKVSDFGLARTVLDPNQDSHTKTDIGPIRWFAPECYAFKYSEKSDVWAYGCSMIELITGRPPFASLKLLQVVAAVKDERRSPLSDLSTDETQRAPHWLLAVMRQCFAFDAKDRPSFKQIVAQLEAAGATIAEVQQVEAEIQKRRNRRADTLRARDQDLKNKR